MEKYILILLFVVLSVIAVSLIILIAGLGFQAGKDMLIVVEESVYHHNNVTVHRTISLTWQNLF